MPQRDGSVLTKHAPVQTTRPSAPYDLFITRKVKPARYLKMSTKLLETHGKVHLHATGAAINPAARLAGKLQQVHPNVNIEATTSTLMTIDERVHPVNGVSIEPRKLTAIHLLVEAPTR